MHKLWLRQDVPSQRQRIAPHAQMHCQVQEQLRTEVLSYLHIMNKYM